MGWGALAFLAEPWFVAPWYAVGIVGAAAVARDLAGANTPLKPAMKWAWPIVVLFFSIVGLALYLGTARAPGVGRLRPQEREAAHERYERNMWRRVNGAVIHCVAGDGLGIMTGMVIARATGMSFWQEFWFEYLVGFLFGWLVFQRKSMTAMADGPGAALVMAFRAEFFSMLTVMGGMGAVMAFVTPMVVGAQPKPLTWAFWGFGMLGLLAGFAFTYPMNWLMVRLGWKHGMGGKDAVSPIEARPARAAVVVAMCALGLVALALPAWLVELRRRTPAEPARTADAALHPRPAVTGVAAIAAGLREDLEEARRGLAEGRRSAAARRLDAARRAAEIGEAAAPGTVFAGASARVRGARRALQVGDPASAREQLASASRLLQDAELPPGAAPGDLSRLEGATVVDASGDEIGEVAEVRGGDARLTLGGAHDVWGFLDLGPRTTIVVPSDALVAGPARTLGPSLVAYPAPAPGGSAQGRRPPPRR